jgi:hypothetical protein
VELENRKALLVREILTNVNDEDALQRLNTFFQRIKYSDNNVLPVPSGLLSDLIDVAK